MIARHVSGAISWNFDGNLACLQCPLWTGMYDPAWRLARDPQRRLKSRRQRLYRTAVVLRPISRVEKRTQPTALRYNAMHPDEQVPRTRVSDPAHPQISSNFKLDHRIAFSQPNPSWQTMRNTCTDLCLGLQVQQGNKLWEESESSCCSGGTAQAPQKNNKFGSRLLSDARHC